MHDLPLALPIKVVNVHTTLLAAEAAQCLIQEHSPLDCHNDIPMDGAMGIYEGKAACEHMGPSPVEIALEDIVEMLRHLVKKAKEAS